MILDLRSLATDSALKVYVINFNRCQDAVKDFPSERFIVDYIVERMREKERKKNQLKYINSLVVLS